MTENIKRSLGERIKQVIKDSAFTQKDFAQKLSITETTVSNYITGKRIPDALLVARFASLSGINLNWLLNGEGSMFLEETVNGEPRAGKGTAEGIALLKEEIVVLRQQNHDLREILLKLSSANALQESKLSSLEDEVLEIKRRLK